MGQDWRPVQLIGVADDGTLIYSMQREPEGLTLDDLDNLSLQQSYISSCCPDDGSPEESPCKDQKPGKLVVPREDDNMPGWSGELWDVPVDPPIGGFRLKNPMGNKTKWFPKRFRYTCGYCDQNLLEYTPSEATANKSKGEGWINPKGKEFTTRHKRTLYWAKEAFYRPPPPNHQTLFYGQPGGYLIGAGIPHSEQIVNPWVPVDPPPEGSEDANPIRRYRGQVPIPPGEGKIENIPYIITDITTHFVLREQWISNPSIAPGYYFFPIPSLPQTRVVYVKLYKYGGYPQTLEEITIPRAGWVINGFLVFILPGQLQNCVINCFWSRGANPIWPPPNIGGYAGFEVDGSFVNIYGATKERLIDVCYRVETEDRMILNVAEPSGDPIYGFNDAWVLDMGSIRGKRQLYVLERPTKQIKDSCICREKGLQFRYLPTNPYEGSGKFGRQWTDWWKTWCRQPVTQDEKPPIILWPDRCSDPKELSWRSNDGGGFDKEITEIPRPQPIKRVRLVRRGCAIYQLENQDYKAKFYHQKEVAGADPDRDSDVKHGWATSSDPFPQIYFKNGWKLTDGYHTFNFQAFLGGDKDGSGPNGVQWLFLENIDGYGKNQKPIITKKEMCCCLGCCDCPETEFLQNPYNQFRQEQEFVNFFPKASDYPSGKDPSIKSRFTPKSIGVRLRASLRDSDKSIKTLGFSVSLAMVGSCAFYGEGTQTSGGDSVYYCILVYRREGHWNYMIRLAHRGGLQFFDMPGSGGNLYSGTLKGLEKYGFETLPCTFDAPHVTHVIKLGIYPTRGQRRTRLDLGVGRPGVIGDPRVFTGPGGSGAFVDRTDCCGGDGHIPNPHPWLNPMTGHQTRVPGEYKKEGKVHYCTCALIRFRGDLVTWSGDPKGRDKYDRLKEWNWVKVEYQGGAITYQIKVCNDEAVIGGHLKLWPQKESDRAQDKREVMVFYKEGFGKGAGWYRGKYFIKAGELQLIEYTSPYSVKADCDCHHSVDNSHLIATLSPIYTVMGNQPGPHPGRYATEDVEANLWFGDAMSFRMVPVYQMTVTGQRWLPELWETRAIGPDGKPIKSSVRDRILTENVRPIWTSLGIFSEGTWIFEFKETSMRNESGQEDLESVDFVFRVGTAEFPVGASKHRVVVTGGTMGIDVRSNKEVRDGPDSEGNYSDPYYKEITAVYYVYKEERPNRAMDIREKYDLTIPHIDIDIIHPCGKATLGDRSEEEVGCKTTQIEVPRDVWPDKLKSGVPTPFKRIKFQYPDPIRIRLEKVDPTPGDPFGAHWASLLNKDLYLKAEERRSDDGAPYLVYRRDYIQVGDEFYYTVQLGGVLEVYGIVYPRSKLYAPWKPAGGGEGEIYDPKDWFYAWGIMGVEWGKKEKIRLGRPYPKSSLHIQGYYQGELSFYTFGEISLSRNNYFMREFKGVGSFGLSVDGSMIFPITGPFTLTYKPPGRFGR